MLGRTSFSWPLLCVFLYVFLGVLAASCGDDDSGVSDSSVPDTATRDANDAGEDVFEPIDSAPPTPDVGAPPGCRGAPNLRVFAAGFDDEADREPHDFASAGADGPWAFAYTRINGDGVARVSDIELRIVDPEGEVARVPLENVVGGDLRVQHVGVNGIAGGFFATWSRSELDAGRLVMTEVRYASVADDGVVVREASTLYDDATAPTVASQDGNVWMLRSDVRFLGDTAVINPRMQRLDTVGDPTGVDSDFATLLRVEATDIQLAPTDEGLKLVYAVPNEAITIPLRPTGAPSNLEQITRNVPSVDSVAASDDSIALGWTRYRDGRVRVGLILMNGRGTEQTRLALEEWESPTTSFLRVVRAWPGFVAFWIQGFGENAVIRAAGVADNGAVIVDPVDVVAAPYATGTLFGHTNGEEVALGFRVRESGEENQLGFASACLPE